MESFEMKFQAEVAGDSNQDVMSPRTAEQGSEQSYGYVGSLDGGKRTLVQVSEELENPVEPHSELVQMPEVEDHPDLIMKLPRYTSDKLYVVDLHPSTVDNVSLLQDLFSQVGKVAVMKVNPKPADTAGKPTLCSAYVNYYTLEDACRAYQTFNYHIWMGVPMRIMFSNLDPATRYNEKANLIVMNLAESIDSYALHRRFCNFGVVLSAKVELDLSGKSTGRGFIQFQDEEDAARAIREVNHTVLEGKIVYVGPFIRRTEHSEAVQINKNPNDLNPAHNPDVDVEVDTRVDIVSHPSQVVEFDIVSQPSQFVEFDMLPEPHVEVVKNEADPVDVDDAGIRSHYIQFGSFPAIELHDFHFGTRASEAHGESSTSNSDSASEVKPNPSGRPAGSKERRKNMKRGTSSERNKARRIAIIEKGLKDIIKGKMASSADSEASSSDPSQPWDIPQPWSVEILKANLAKAHCPEERLAMLGATLLPLISHHTKCFVSDITNELVKMDMEEIEKIMKLSAKALSQKVEEVKQVIFERIKNQPPFVPASAVAHDPVELPAVVPDFPVPIVPEFLQPLAVPEFLQPPVAPPMPWWLPYLPHPQVPQPYYPPCVLNYPYMRRGPGTGYYEPRGYYEPSERRVTSLHGLYRIAEAEAEGPEEESAQDEQAETKDQSAPEVQAEAMDQSAQDEQAEAMDQSAPEVQAEADESEVQAAESAPVEEQAQAEESAEKEVAQLEEAAEAEGNSAQE